MYETTRKEKALLVLVIYDGERKPWPVEEQKEEFRNLVSSTGIEVACIVTVKRKALSPALYIGKGKAAELAQEIEESGVDTVIFNNNLNFTQQRNLENIFGIKTIDRTQLILDIFSRHARTQEGSLQVELAQLEYLLPRLRGKGIMLSRLGGGIGTRGPGEKKLEVERRRIADRIIKLKKDLDQLRRQRQVQRKKRHKEKIGVCSLVGYTNAGKTTLLNSVTGTVHKTSDSLFTTLDTVSRTISLNSGFKMIMSDTVGFIYKLPHNLIEAFKATLEELQYADILIHVVDASSNNYQRLIAAVESVLGELDLGDKPMILVFNKIDRIQPFEIEKLKSLYSDAVFISALDGVNLNLLIDKIKEILTQDAKQLIVKFPFESMGILDYLYKNAEVFKVEYGPAEVIVWVRIKADFIPYLEKKGVKTKEI